MTPDDIRDIINNSRVIEMDYRGTNPEAPDTYRLVHIMNFGRGQGPYDRDKWYFRFWHVNGQSNSMGIVRMVWRTGILDNVEGFTITGNKWRVSPQGFKPTTDAYINIDTIWQAQRNN